MVIKVRKDVNLKIIINDNSIAIFKFIILTIPSSQDWPWLGGGEIKGCKRYHVIEKQKGRR